MSSLPILTASEQVADTISLATQIMISLELSASDSTLTSTLEDVYTNAANEYQYGQGIASVGIAAATNAVEATTTEAKSEISKWEDEALAASSLSLAASAAQIAAAVFSWAPGVNLCIDAGAIAAYVAAQQLQQSAEDYEGTVISYIGNFNNNTIGQPGLEAINQWNTAVQNNVINFKKLSLGATNEQIQATLMAITNSLLSSNQALTPQNYGNVVYGVALARANNPGIDQAWNKAMVAISQAPAADLPSTIASQAAALKAAFPGAWDTTVTVMSLFTSVMTIVDFKTWVTVRRVFQFNFADTGNVAAADQLTQADPEVARLATWSTRVKALGAIVNVAVAVMSIIAIVDTVEAASEMTDAVDQAHDGMLQYLTTLIQDAAGQQSATSS
ncbi:hypothetical protein GGR74_000810 [Xanthomonas arboricola]